MAKRYEVSVGVECAVCGKDNWLALAGHNRCQCGQLLWIEKNDGPGTFNYAQGAALPRGYRGWLEVTGNGAKDGVDGRKPIPCRWCGEPTKNTISQICAPCAKRRDEADAERLVYRPNPASDWAN